MTDREARRPSPSDSPSHRQEFAALLLPLAALVVIAASSRDSHVLAGPASAFAEPVAPASSAKAAHALRVCSDPNNLPFSNRAREGFENHIAEVLGRDLGMPVEYTWWAQRRGFIRNTIKAGLCDVVLGTPSNMDMLLTTRSYYRSTYVFVSRRDRHLGIRSFDDPRLRRLSIGVQLIGDDFANTPPAHALSARGMVRNIVGYPVYGDYRRPNPPARIVDAVANGDVDIAVVWGPLAGYFAPRESHALQLTPVSPQIDLPYLPFVFDIAMGVRRGDTTFRARLDSAIERRRPAIDSILNAYHIPRLDPAGSRRTF